MTLLKLIACFTCVFVVSAHADQALTEQQITEGAKLLAEDFKPYVITLDRDIQVYHYFRNSQIGDLPLLAPEWDHHLLRGLNYFWAEWESYSVHSHDPVYAAIDPYISRAHGSFLLEITIQKGTHILIGHHNIKLSDQTIAAIHASALYAGARFDSVIQAIPREILAKTLATLDVEAATYLWGSPSPNYACDLTYATFILLGTPLDLDSAKSGTGVVAKHMKVTAGYTANATDFSDPNKLAAYTRIDRFLTSTSQQPLSHNSENADLSGFSTAERNRWRDMIFSCDGLHPADEPPAFRKAN